MFGITGKWGWHDWLIVFLRVSWSIFTLIEITHSREIFPIPYWMMVGLVVVVFSVPFILAHLSSRLYLAAEFILTGSFFIWLASIEPLFTNLISALMIQVGFYSGDRKNNKWSIPSMALVFGIMLWVSHTELQSFITESLDLIVLFGIGYMIHSLVMSKDKVQKQNDVIEDQYKILEQYAKQVEQMTTEQERNRISGEIHDSVGHTITSIVLGLETLKKNVISGKVLTEVERLLETARTGLNDVRTSVHQMEPLDIKLSLSDRLLNAVEEFKATTHIDVQFNSMGEEPLLPKQTKLTLARCMQESLTNAVRHGGASLIHVLLQYDRDQVILKIEDDGKGSEDLRLGFGLNTMKERLNILQGDLFVSSFLNKGMTVQCTVPVQQSSDKKKIRIIIVDDDQVVRESMESMLSMQEDIEIVGLAENGEKAVALCEEIKPDLVLMDIHMDVMNGVEAAKQIKEQLPSIRVMMMTTFDEMELAVEAIHAGAEGYLLKTTPPKDLLSKIRLVYLGGTIISQEVAKRLVGQLTTSDKENLQSTPTRNKYGLTERELEILQFLAEGLRYKAISEKLYLAEGTVRNYISTIYSKLEVRNRDEASEKAFGEDLI